MDRRRAQLLRAGRILDRRRFSWSMAMRGAGKGNSPAPRQICLGRKPMIVQQTADEKSERELITSVALSGK